MGIKLTETQWLLLELLINNAVRLFMFNIENMSKDQLQETINAEEVRKGQLIERLLNG